MTIDEIRALKHGDIIQNKDTGQALTVANQYDEQTHSFDVYRIERLPLTSMLLSRWSKTEWPN